MNKVNRNILLEDLKKELLFQGITTKEKKANKEITFLLFESVKGKRLPVEKFLVLNSLEDSEIEDVVDIIKRRLEMKN